jgi:hypothetical protein
MLCLEAVFRFKETCFMFVIKLFKDGYSTKKFYLSTFLQDTDYDILEAIKESKTVNEMLRAERQDIIILI